MTLKAGTTGKDSMANTQLVHVLDDVPGIRRRRKGKGFCYTDAHGKAIRDADTLARIRMLAIPPAWTEVWICPADHGHIQATGRDARGRKQYRYHTAFRAQREEQKYDHLTDFARALPAIRQTIAQHMALPGLPREKVLATIVHLLETTLIRVGNADYARANQSYGLTTLRGPHVNVSGSELRFHFKGKSGKVWRLKISDRRVAKIVKACQDLPGQHLFQYRDQDDTPRQVSSTDVNAYLREITNQDVTAKDFRTWSGTVLAALALAALPGADSPATAKRNIKGAIELVAGQLGNTVTICRKCYVHPTVVDRYMAGTLRLKIKPRASSAHFRTEEEAVLALLQPRARRAARNGQKRAA
jgi:DNA topoisomerase-1